MMPVGLFASEMNFFDDVKAKRTPGEVCVLLSVLYVLLMELALVSNPISLRSRIVFP